MGLPEAKERHDSGSGLYVGSVALFVSVEAPAELSHQSIVTCPGGADWGKPDLRRALAARDLLRYWG